MTPKYMLNLTGLQNCKHFEDEHELFDYLTKKFRSFAFRAPKEERTGLVFVLTDDEGERTIGELESLQAPQEAREIIYNELGKERK
jgi:hypothetical protein